MSSYKNTPWNSNRADGFFLVLYPNTERAKIVSMGGTQKKDEIFSMLRAYEEKGIPARVEDKMGNVLS